LTIAIERHFTPFELGQLWQLDSDTVRALFAGEPGVLRIDWPEAMRKWRYASLRIPESIAVRIHERLEVKQIARVTKFASRKAMTGLS
jgi:hypothetical protein